jgi:hypothetical protein
MRYALPVFAALSVAACSSTKVTVNYDRALDFRTFHTYSFARPPAGPQATPYPLLGKEVAAAVDAQLRKKGLTPVATSGDLVVHLQTGVTRGYDVASTAYGPRFGMARGSAQVRPVSTGSLVVDLVDAHTKELAWRAVSSDEIDPRISPEDRASRIAEVTKTMFREFPPR